MSRQTDFMATQVRAYFVALRSQDKVSGLISVEIIHYYILSKNPIGRRI